MSDPLWLLLLGVSFLPLLLSGLLVWSRWHSSFVSEVLATFLPAVTVFNLAVTTLLLLVFSKTTEFNVSLEKGLLSLNLVVISWLIGRVVYFCFFKPPTTQSPTSSFRVISFNKLINNSNNQRIAKRINELDADIVGLSEVKLLDLKPLSQHLHIAHTHASQAGYGLAKAEFLIASKHPFTNVRTLDLSEFTAGLKAQINVNGHPLQVFLIHATAPLTPYLLGDRTQALSNLAKLLQQYRAQPVLVFGDFNTTPWSAGYEQFERELGTKFYNVARGKGLRFTWKHAAGVYAQLDHIFTSKPTKTKSFIVDQPLGSDHRLIYADLNL